MMDSDSDVDFDIEPPASARMQPPGKKKKPQAQAQKSAPAPKGKSRPFTLSNALEDEDDDEIELAGVEKPSKGNDNDKRKQESSSVFEPEPDRNINSSPAGNSRGRSGSTAENRPPLSGGRPSYLEDSSDEEPDPASLLPPAIRPRKRLSIRHDRSVGPGGKPKTVTDPATLKNIYSTCLELFNTHKISQENAFNLKLLDMMNDLMDIPGFDKNDMKGAGKMLETGARIYACRVEKTKHTVQDIVSSLATKKEQRRLQQANNLGEGETDMPEGLGDEGIADNTLAEEAAAQAKAKKKRQPAFIKHKEDRFIAADDKICLVIQADSAEGKRRREMLNRKFSDMLANGVEFDYGPYIDKELLDQEQEEDEESAEEVTTPYRVPDVVTYLEDFENLEDMNFELQEEFDPKIFDIWGMLRPFRPESMSDLSLTSSTGTGTTRPLTGTTEEMDTDMPNGSPLDLPAAQEPTIAPDLIYQPAVEQPDDYNFMGYNEEDNFANITFADDDGRGGADNDSPVRPPNIKNIKSIKEFFDLYTKMRAKMGWCGPGFVRPAYFQKTGAATQKRAKKEPKVLDYKNMDWNKHCHKFQVGKPEKTVLDERTIGKWSICGRKTTPYLGIEDFDDEEFEMINTRTKPGVLDVDDVPELYRCFVDVKDNILRHMYKPEKRDSDMDENDEFFDPNFHKEEEDYIRDAGFEYERHADDDFERNDPNDQYRAEPDYAMVASFRFSDPDPMALGGMFFDSEQDPTEPTEPTATEGENSESVQFNKKPKPIDMHYLKKVILEYLKEELQLNDDGSPRLAEETSTGMHNLIKEVYKRSDPKMADLLSVSIIFVALMHVVVDNKLFVMPNSAEEENQTILCHGSAWKHGENIPQVGPEDLDIY